MTESMVTPEASFLKRLSQMSLFKQLSWYTLAQLVVQGSAFFSAIIVSRYMGPTNLGVYSFVQNYVGTALTIIGGMDFYFVWKLAKSEDYFRDVQLYIGHKFHIYIILAVIGIVSAWMVLPADVAFMVTLMLVPVFIQSLNIFSYYAMATDRAKLVSAMQIIVSVTLLLLKIVLVYVQAPLYAFVVVSAIDLILSGIIMSTYFLRFKEWRDALKISLFPSFLQSVTFLFSIRVSIIALMLWQFLLRIDQLILATLANAYTLGIYSAAVKVAEVPNFLAGVLSTALISRMAALAGQEDATSRSKMKKIMLGYFGLGTAIALFIIIFAPLAIHILYGARFADSVSVLRVYALSIPGMFMNYFFLGMYGVKDRHHNQVVIFGTAVVVNVVLVYLLTGMYGVVGTALATAVAYTVAALGFYFNLDRKK